MYIISNRLRIARQLCWQMTCTEPKVKAVLFHFLKQHAHLFSWACILSLFCSLPSFLFLFLPSFILSFPFPSFPFFPLSPPTLPFTRWQKAAVTEIWVDSAHQRSQIITGTMVPESESRIQAHLLWNLQVLSCFVWYRWGNYRCCIRYC